MHNDLPTTTPAKMTTRQSILAAIDSVKRRFLSRYRSATEPFRKAKERMHERYVTTNFCPCVPDQVKRQARYEWQKHNKSILQLCTILWIVLSLVFYAGFQVLMSYLGCIAGSYNMGAFIGYVFIGFIIVFFSGLLCTYIHNKLFNVCNTVIICTAMVAALFLVSGGLFLCYGWYGVCLNGRLVIFEPQSVVDTPTVYKNATNSLSDLRLLAIKWKDAKLLTNYTGSYSATGSFTYYVAPVVPSDPAFNISTSPIPVLLASFATTPDISRAYVRFDWEPAGAEPVLEDVHNYKLAMKNLTGMLNSTYGLPTANIKNAVLLWYKSPSAQYQNAAGIRIIGITIAVVGLVLHIFATITGLLLYRKDMR